MVVFGFCFFEEYYFEWLKECYVFDEILEDIVELFDVIGEKCGCFMSGGFINYDKMIEVIICDICIEKFGWLLFE